MAQPFKHDAANLHDFFSQGGRGFYIPYYQRNYSWDEENARKLIEDIFSSIKRTLTKPNNSIFLGTVILHEEKNAVTGVHTDTPNLLTKIVNVVDGQQRITSIAMLACVIGEQITEMVSKLQTLAGAAPEFDKLATELTDELPNIRRFYSVEISKTGAQPALKPKIIRADDVSTNPVSDQWTLSGDINKFYRSNTSSFLSKFIAGIALDAIPTDERVGLVLRVFREYISEQINTADVSLATGLLSANSVTDGSLSNFMAYPPNWTTIHSLPPDEQSVYFGGMLLLAACSFLKNSCHLVVIECLDLGLAFDMFQSLNATGTPLTAFEVFKPQIVKAWGTGYSTVIKSQVDRIQSVFETESNSSDKEELTDKVIVSSALVFNGMERSRRFSEERDWLTDTLENSLVAGSPTQKSIDFVTCIADQAEYFLSFIKPRKSPKNANSFGLCTQLQTMGLTPQQADRAAFCVFYLKDAGHQFAHVVLSVFYSKLLRAQSNAAAKTAAAAEFVSVCEATVAFFTLFMGAQLGRFPDSDYRTLFQSEAGNISFANGAANQTTTFVKTAFRKALESQKIYDAADPVVARQIWVDLAKENAWYSRKAVCRFALLASAHDAAPDLTTDNEGFFTNGMASSADLLNCRVWHSSQYEVIEHVATQDQPSSIKFAAHFDATVYPGNYSIVDKLGNLTLLSRPVNSSIYSEWPDKVFYYWNLTTPASTAKGPTGAALAVSLGIGSVPPALSTLVASSNYLSHLAPLAFRGQCGLHWDAAFIAKRSEHLCQRVFDKLDAWLR
ncbi:GmrSD restriction endonuclease domain-containing protein [Janthinobacterium sp. LB2P10]|uniref:GmrSD restriction endonuclease domain-containing protein n=1 Tax=Janthinobacterium sp. LB2P10 TaxID=3424194 RepID=UPI003F1EDF81